MLYRLLGRHATRNRGGPTFVLVCLLWGTFWGLDFLELGNIAVRTSSEIIVIVVYLNLYSSFKELPAHDLYLIVFPQPPILIVCVAINVLIWFVEIQRPGLVVILNNCSVCIFRNFETFIARPPTQKCLHGHKLRPVFCPFFAQDKPVLLHLRLGPTAEEGLSRSALMLKYGPFVQIRQLLTRIDDCFPVVAHGPRDRIASHNQHSELWHFF